MTRRFTCRGFEGQCVQVYHGCWDVYVVVAGVHIRATATSEAAAKSRVRRKLDAVEKAFRERRPR